MKKIILTFIIIYSYGNNIQDILNMSKLLKNYKTEYRPIKKIFDPFLMENKKRKTIIVKPIIYHQKIKKPVIIKRDYHLEIFFLDKVRINGKWYKNNDKIDDYRVIIKNNNVYLVNKIKTIKLKNNHSLLKVSQ